MNKINSLLNKYKKEYRAKTGYTKELMISDSELLVQWQDRFASELNGHSEFWRQVIDWADERFSLISNLPMSGIEEKRALIQGLSCYDPTKLTNEQHAALLSDLHQVLNKPSKDAYILSANRVKGGKASSKRSLEIDKKILERSEALEKTALLKKVIVLTLAQEFNLSEVTIRRILKKK